MEAGAGGSTADGGFNNLRVQKTDSNGVIGTYYDEIAASISTAAGNYRLGAYNDSSGPNTLYAETGSLAAATGYTYKSLTEFALDTAVVWTCINYDDNSFKHHRTASASFPSGDGKVKSAAFGAFPNPFGTPDSDVNYKWVTKIRHS